MVGESCCLRDELAVWAREELMVWAREELAAWPGAIAKSVPAASSLSLVHQHRLADGCARGHIGQDSRRFADRGALGYAHRYLA